METIKNWMLVAVLLAVEWSTWSAPAFAEERSCQLTVATGAKGKIYSRLLHDIASVCGFEVKLCELETQGGLVNSQKLLAHEVELGFVQEDTLTGMKHTDENLASLQAVVAVNSNFLHILATSEGYLKEGPRRFFDTLPGEKTRVVIHNLSDLKELPVATVGSAQHLAPSLDKTYGLAMRFVPVDSEEQAIALLRTGEVAATMSMSGWPNTTVETVARDGSMHLVAYDLPVRAPYRLVHKSYQKLGLYGMEFLAVKNLLVTRPFKLDGPYGAAVNTLQRCLVRHLDQLHEGRFEPGWMEVTDLLDTHGWPRFGAIMCTADKC